MSTGNKLMLWKAIYDNGLVLSEDINSFDDIDRSKLKQFMLEGLDTRFTHNVNTGQTNINEHNIVFLLNDKLIGKSSDIINYKEKIKLAIGRDPQLENNIIGYYTGWKEKNEDFDYIEVLYWVDMITQELKVRFRATPKHIGVLNSTLSVIINGTIFNEEITFSNINKRGELIYELFKTE